METEKTKTRKPHKKSRNGCRPCKARHVKCDETKPACINCDKYGSQCEYPVSKKRITSSDHISPSTPSSNDTFPNQVASGAQDSSLNISHLRLLHHFTTVTAKTLAFEPEAADVYHTYMIKLSFDYPFVLQGILALAALHLSRLEPNLQTKFMRQAEHHHDAALVQFRNDVSNIDGTNFEPVLLFANTLYSYSCALSIDSQHEPEHALDAILQNLTLTRRIRPMVREVYPRMMESELRRIRPHDTLEISFDETPTETELVELRKFSEITQHLYPPDINEAYGEAIRGLQVIYSRAERSPIPPSDSLLKMWVHMVSDRFMDLLAEKQPGALIIFAHYAVLFRRSQRYWFFEGVAEQMLYVAESFVPTEWKSWLQWPRDQIGASTFAQDAHQPSHLLIPTGSTPR